METVWVIPCWLCGSLIPVKFTKKNKPFLICNNCGVQTFIRYGKAEDLLIAKIKDYRKGG
jgi:rRNA maturation endonuclease Nob1